MPIRKGTYINTVLASANRDPRKFENPDEFDIFRSRSTRHIACASGPPLCIVQHLARVEMTRALNAILDRIPKLRLDPDKPAPEIKGHLPPVPEHPWGTFDRGPEAPGHDELEGAEGWLERGQGRR